MQEVFGREHARFSRNACFTVEEYWTRPVSDSTSQIVSCQLKEATPGEDPRNGQSVLDSEWIQQVFPLFLMTFAYYGAVKLGLLLRAAAGDLSPVWPAAGLALAGTLAFGYRMSLGIFLGGLLAHFSATSGAASFEISLLLGFCIALGASLQAILGAFLIRRFVPYPSDFVELRQTIMFFLLGGPISCLVSATCSVTALLLTGFVRPSDYWFLWGAWWTRNTIGVFTCVLPLLVWTEKAPAFSRRRKLLVSVPIAVGLVLSVLLALYVNGWEHYRIKQVFERRTSALVQQLTDNFESYVDVVSAVASHFMRPAEVSREEFQKISAPWFARHPGIRSLSWNPLIKDRERQHYEDLAKRQGAVSFEIKEPSGQGQFVRAAPRAEYFPSFYHATLRGNNRTLGFDYASEPIRRELLERVRVDGRPMASRETVLLTGNGEPGFLIAVPVFAGEAFPQTMGVARDLRGYVCAIVETRNVLGSLMREHEGADIDIFLRQKTDSTEPNDRAADKRNIVQLAQTDPVTLQSTVSFEAARRNWSATFTPTAGYLKGASPSHSWGILLAGLFSSGLFGTFLLAVTGHSVRLQAINAELHQETLIRQAAHDDLKTFAMMVDSSDDAIVSAKWGGEILTWNYGAEKLYGYSAEEMADRSAQLLYPPQLSHEHAEFRERLQRGERVEQYETMRVRKDGTPVWVSLTLSAMKNEHGEVTGVVSVSRDITERKQAEARLQQAREQIARRLHDSVAQSLAAMTIHLELAQDDLAANPARATGYLNRLTQILSAERLHLRRLLSDLKGPRYAESAEDSDAREALESLLIRLEQQWNLRIELEVSENLDLSASAIEDNLFYIIQEAVANAKRHGDASLVRIALAIESGGFIVSIADNGRGFSSSGDCQASPENQTDFAGPKSLEDRIRALGGTLAVHSSPDGVSLKMTMPLTSARSAA